MVPDSMEFYDIYKSRVSDHRRNSEYRGCRSDRGLSSVKRLKSQRVIADTAGRFCIDLGKLLVRFGERLSVHNYPHGKLNPGRN